MWHRLQIVKRLVLHHSPVQLGEVKLLELKNKSLFSQIQRKTSVFRFSQIC